MISATDALEQLKNGNRRFVEHDTRRANDAEAYGESRAAGQSPLAVVLSCSDSRVPPEIIFDRGVGDLFVIRVAGNVVEPTVLGSVEYAASILGTHLIVVLGHSNCGAVTAALKEVKFESSLRSSNLLAIVDRIRPSINAKQTLEESISTNVRGSVEQLQRGSQILSDLVADGELTIVGAEYSIESGDVAFQE